jgi:hypothetical protein
MLLEINPQDSVLTDRRHGRIPAELVLGRVPPQSEHKPLTGLDCDWRLVLRLSR